MRTGLRIWVVMSICGLAAAGCETEPQPVGYLTDSVGHTTQAEVKDKLGTPSLAAAALDGGTVWTYHYARGKPGSATYECLEYALRFDQEGLLRSWVQTECLETVPDFTPSDDQGKQR